MIKFKLLAFLLGLVMLTSGAALSQGGEDRAEDMTQAPNWVVSTVEGIKISLEDSVRGDDKVVMVFWATWCRYCRDLIPRLDALHQQVNAKTPDETKPQITFVAFNIWEDGNPQHYMSSKQLGLPLSLRAEDIAKKYKVRGTPAVFVVGKNRQILYRRQPGHDVEQTLAAVRNLVAP